MGFLITERNSRQLAGLGQHSMAIGQACQCGGIEGGERVERVALDIRSQRCRKHKVVIEGGVVAHQHGALAVEGFYRLADRRKNLAQAFALRHRFPLRVPRINAGEIQGRLFQVGAFERIDLLHVGFAPAQPTVFVHGQQYGGNFQQGIPLGIEACSFNIHNHRQKAAKALGQRVWLFVFF